MTYASNKDVNSVMVDGQKLAEMEALIERQRVIIERFVDACDKWISTWSPYDSRSLELWENLLYSAWEAAQNTDDPGMIHPAEDHEHKAQKAEGRQHDDD